MRRIVSIADDSTSGELWMERRGATNRGRGVRESREYLLADYWDFLGYRHVVVLRRQYDCSTSMTRLIGTTYYVDTMQPVVPEEPAAEAFKVPETAWERRALEYVCRGAWVQGETKPKQTLILDFLKDNRPAD